MNRQDLKLYLLAGGYKVKNNGILSFNLDPETNKKFKILRKNNGWGGLSKMFTDWISKIEFSNESKELIEFKDIEANVKSFTHKQYRYNSFFIGYDTKRKVKQLAADSDITASSLVRYFIHSLEK